LANPRGIITIWVATRDCYCDIPAQNSVRQSIKIKQMRYLATIALIFFQLLAFSQTKEDLLTCFEIITEHDDFQPAFENRGITGESLIIVTNNSRSINQNEFEKIRHSLTNDDFYDFRETIKVIQGDERAVRNQGYDPKHVLNFGFSTNHDFLVFFLNTVVENQNLRYDWNYKFVKEEGEWTLIGQNINKIKVR
jgi:hypothetical protein